VLLAASRPALRGVHTAHALCQDTPLHLAAFAGRGLIVSALLSAGCGRCGMVRERNRDLMSPLQLAVCDEARGCCTVVRSLLEAGASIDEPCWDVTPLMAAAAAGHSEAVQLLLELGADAALRNGARYTRM